MLIRSNCTEALVQLSPRNSNELTGQQNMFYYMTNGGVNKPWWNVAYVRRYIMPYLAKTLDYRQAEWSAIRPFKTKSRWILNQKTAVFINENK